MRHTGAGAMRSEWFACRDAQEEITNRWRSPRVILPPRMYVTMPGDIFNCHTWGGGAAGMAWEEGKEAAKHPPVPRKPLQQRIVWSKMPGVLRLQNPVLNTGRRYGTGWGINYITKTLSYPRWGFSGFFRFFSFLPYFYFEIFLDSQTE